MVSVIITIYNKSGYLKRCVDSVLGQSFSDIEVILVDDGSTDDSVSIIDEYEQKDGRVCAIHKKNGGATTARKEGLRYSEGEYVLFVDADDWIEEDTISVLMTQALNNDSDVVTAGWCIHYGNSMVADHGYMSEGVYRSYDEKQEFANNMIYCDNVLHNGINASLNTKLFKKELIYSTLKELPDGIVYAEDDFVTYAILAIADCVVVTHLILYHYTMNEDSVSHSQNNWFLRDLNQGYLYFKRIVENSIVRNACMKQIELYMLRAVLYGMPKYLGFVFGGDFSWYRFDEAIIPENSKIVIYGAGGVGRCYYRQLKRSKKHYVIAWIDQQYKWYSERGYDVCPVEALDQINYDYIVLAVAEKKLAGIIERNLITEYNVEINKIVWIVPINDIDDNLSGLLNIGQAL